MDSCPDTDIDPSPLGSPLPKLYLCLWRLGVSVPVDGSDTGHRYPNRTLVSQIGLLCPKSDTSV